ncbi:unnamed protein product [Rotaria magnacalcarata]|uniref:Putative auto-transporter adhesin head GIN domain-containing protein n=4 Tax=Rotaria magnacalcarata TaxID=392030 RepID=A0A817AGX3_9BILA|nr:unnamed protein product [Rotaria magnacalcarata]CAF1387342.1 unnamed protein product [Rotaria magnacalcarata]CAF2245100.1 unnamed protein product [Rotaria magnacalcarata]CAF3786027.1 unnamed protein product [Rotaria magnacalcarata]
MFYVSALFSLLLLELPINDSIGYQGGPVTIIGDKSMTLRSNEIPQALSKLILDGPFYCYVEWTQERQTIDIYTDYNFQPYIVVNISPDTLSVIFQYDGNYKFTEMDIYLNLNPRINDIFLGGLATLSSINALRTYNSIKLHAQDTSNLILQLEVLNLDAMFLSAGTTQLTGHVKGKSIIKYFGIGNVDASELYCKFVDVEANGLGTISVSGTQGCNIKAEGVSTVKYNCSNTHNIQLSGLAKLIPM